MKKKLENQSKIKKLKIVENVFSSPGKI